MASNGTTRKSGELTADVDKEKLIYACLACKAIFKKKGMCPNCNFVLKKKAS